MSQQGTNKRTNCYVNSDSLQNRSAGAFLKEKEASHADGSHARFQRTDQWRPVYAWLESLDRTEVVKSKDISEWLNQNPEVKEQLCSRHSRYHLMHYVKKCHVKIIKRKQKKKGLQQAGKAISLSPQASTVMKPPTQSSPKLRNVPKDSELYVSKRNEALRKYQLLVELEAYFQVRWRGNDKTQ